MIVSPTYWPPLPPVCTSGTHFCYRLGKLQGHRVAGRIKSVKNPNNPKGNQTYKILHCSTVSQPTVPPPKVLQLYSTIPQPAESMTSIQDHNLVPENLVGECTSAYICFSTSISRMSIRL
jgi:hypothetical protein